MTIHDSTADSRLEFASQPAGLGIVMGKLVANQHLPSALQKRFNSLMARIGAKQTLSRALRHAAESYGPSHRLALSELHQEKLRLCKRLMVLLDQHIQAPEGLTAKQKQQATSLLLAYLEVGPRPDDDTVVDVLRQRYAPQAAIADQCPRAGDEWRADLESEQKRARARAEKLEAKRQAKRAQRNVQKGSCTNEIAAGQKQLDAQDALRTVYRQLASALHPDREPEEQARKRKTALMSEVNAAYARKELSTLLRIQLQSQVMDASKPRALTDAQLKAMCDLLTEQAKALEVDNVNLRNYMEFEFGYPVYVQFQEADLLVTLLQVREHAQEDAAQLAADLELVQGEIGLKAWLKRQARHLKSEQRASPLDNMEDRLFATVHRR